MTFAPLQLESKMESSDSATATSSARSVTRSSHGQLYNLLSVTVNSNSGTTNTAGKVVTVTPLSPGRYTLKSNRERGRRKWRGRGRERRD